VKTAGNLTRPVLHAIRIGCLNFVIVFIRVSNQHLGGFNDEIVTHKSPGCMRD
jgi:hypothetical protein